MEDIWEAMLFTLKANFGWFLVVVTVITPITLIAILIKFIEEKRKKRL